MSGPNSADVAVIVVDELGSIGELAEPSAFVVGCVGGFTVGKAGAGAGAGVGAVAAQNFL